MRKVISFCLLLSMLVNPVYLASSADQELDSLTSEQKKLQKEISKKAEEITDAQIELDSINNTIDTNNQQITSLEQTAKEKQEDIDNQLSSFNSTLVVLQKLHNQNALLSYLVSNDEDNFLLKYKNVMALSTAIQENLKTFITDLKAINESLAKIESYTQQNIDNQSQIEDLLAEQDQLDSELRTSLNSVDSDILSKQTEISLEQAQAMESSQAEETEKSTEKEQSDADKTANNDKPEEPEVVEPEEPEVVEPEEPEVVEPDEPDVVEPEIPDGGDSIYPDSGNVSGYKNQLIASAGISSSDTQYVDYIITKESGWNYLAVNSYSGAYGLCQALPGSKMSTAGSDWATNPETQISWCNSYAITRYGSWSAAYDFWLENNYW